MSNSNASTAIPIDVAVIGGGQSALAVAYFLRRAGLGYVVLDDQPAPGGAWQHAWDSLHLFSPAQWSSLPGWLMPATSEHYPSRDQVVRYLTEYEKRYEIAVRRPVDVTSVSRHEAGLLLSTDHGEWLAKAVVSATGTWGRPYIPDYPGQGSFEGEQLHSAHYRRPEIFHGKDVLVVGGGNSGAQILAELSQVCHTTWGPLDFVAFYGDSRGLAPCSSAKRPY